MNTDPTCPLFQWADIRAYPPHAPGPVESPPSMTFYGHPLRPSRLCVGTRPLPSGHHLPSLQADPVPESDVRGLLAKPNKGGAVSFTHDVLVPCIESLDLHDAFTCVYDAFTCAFPPATAFGLFSSYVALFRRYQIVGRF